MKSRTPRERCILIILAAITMFCGSAPGSWAAQPPVALDYVLRLIGRHASAHACPISPRLALTSAHVVDLRPFDSGIGLFPYGWSDGFGFFGWVTPLSVESARDLARIEPLSGDNFPHPIPVAKVVPMPGDRVWFLGYRFDNPKNVMAEERVEARVTRIVASHVFYVPAGHPGSSGSCVLNDAGEVVGIVEGGFTTEEHEEGGFAVGVWGELIEPPMKEKKE